MKSKYYIILFLVFALPYLSFSQEIKEIEQLESITFIEQTSTTFSYEFAINSDELNTQLTSPLTNSNNDFVGAPGAEFFDVYYSDGDGSFNVNGEFITIEISFVKESGGGGGNINEVQFNFNNGVSIFANHLESFFANGINYIENSELKAVDCNIETWSTLGNVANTSKLLRLTLGIQKTFTEINYFGCQGDGYSVVVNGITYDQSNPIGSEILSSTFGCDSLVLIDLEFGQEFLTEINYSGCQGDGYSITVNGNIYDQNNPTGLENILSVEGCDSLISIFLDFEEILYSEFNYSACKGDGFSLILNGNIYDESNPTGVESLISSKGCDSLVDIQLMFNDDYVYSDIHYSGCLDDGYAITINEILYDQNNPTGIDTLLNLTGCDTIVQTQLLFQDCTLTACKVYVPNVFSPNQDGLNDYFSIFPNSHCEIEEFKFSIYNRWGEKILDTEELSFKWDGEFKGQSLNSGIFAWMMEYKEINSATIQKSGAISIFK